MLLQRGRDIALASGQRLLADVVVGHFVGKAARHLDVVAEDFVVADPQRLNTAALLLDRLELVDPGLGAEAALDDVVHMPIEARPDHSARQLAVLFGGAQVVRRAQQRWRVVVKRLLKKRQHVGAGVELRAAVLWNLWPDRNTGGAELLPASRLCQRRFGRPRRPGGGWRLVPLVLAEQVVIGGIARCGALARFALLAQTRCCGLGI